MKIKVTHFAGNDKKVYFECSVGNGAGIWRNKTVPTVGQIYDVEIDIERSLLASDISFDQKDQVSSISYDSELLLNGKVESIEEDGVAYIRLANDCLIMIETEKTTVKPAQNVRLKLDVRDLEITAQGI